MGIVKEKTQCPQCKKQGGDTSGDNLIVYTDGAKCFACGYTERGHSVPVVAEEPKVLPFEQIHDYSIPSRGIREKTCKFAGAGQSLTTNKIIFSYKDYKGVEIAQKVRTEDKRFYTAGHSIAMPLYLQWLWEPNDKLGVVITEGEMDALSILEVQGCKWPVVSLPNGAGSASASIKRHIKWLQGFKHVTLAFDNDPVGQKAVEDCVELFEPGKVKVANWLHVKDANDALMSDKFDGKAHVDTVLLRAQTYRPDKIVTVQDVRERILTTTEVGVSWPWPSMTNLTRGVRMQELTVLMGPASVGKTTLSLECVHHMAFKHGMKCGIMSFEQSVEETYQALCGMQINKPLLDPATHWEPSEIEEPLDKLNNVVYTCDNMAPKSFDDIKQWIRYFSIALGCKFLLIDNLSNISVTFDRDEVRGIQKAMVAMFDLTRMLDTHILLMCHVTDHNKSGKTFEEGKSLRLSDARGSDAIGHHCTALFGAERNALADDVMERNQLTMRCLKMRKIGPSRGKSFNLTYQPQTGRIVEQPLEFGVI
jgi:twinkle protein